MKNIQTTGQTVFSSVIWKFGERVVTQGVTFIISLVLARLLMPSEFGIIAMLLVFINLANVFVDGGFSASLIQKKEADELDFSTIFYCSFFVSIVLYVLIYLLSPCIAVYYHQPLLTILLRVLALKLPLSVYSIVQHAYVSRHMLFRKLFWSSFIAVVISGAVGICMAYYGHGVWALICQVILAVIVETFVLMIIVPWHPKFLFSFFRAKSLMDFGWKIFAANLSGTFFNELRNLLIGRIYLPADLAFYSRGDNLSRFVSNNITSTITAVLFPALSNANDSPQNIKLLLRKAVKDTAYIVFPCLIGLALVAKQLIVVLIGEKWLPAATYLQVLSISGLLGVLSETSLESLKAIGRSDVLFKLEIYKKPIYFLLLVIGVYNGVYVIAVTMLMYSFYGSVVNSFQMVRYLNYSIKEQIEDITPAFLLTICMSIPVYGLSICDFQYKVVLWLQIIIGVFVYIICSAILKNSSFYYIMNKLFGKVMAKW